MIILYVLIGLLVGSLGIYLLLRPKLKITAQKNIAIEQANQQLVIENENLININKHREELLEKTTQEYQEMGAKRQELKKNLEDLKETQEKAAKDYYNSALQIAQVNFDNEIENLSNKLNQAREDASQAYAETLKEAVTEYQKEIEEKHLECGRLVSRIAAYQKDVAIAAEAAKRKLEMETKQSFYTLNLPQEDIMEINKLREVLPYLRDKEPLNKVIYQTYYAKPYSDLVGRVIGVGRHTGIYKITNLKNGMCYVGQSVDIAERWRQHIKRGVGAEAPTRNKLYPAMLAIGVENFTFEVIEECERSKLDEREDYWQNYFHAKDFGYSIK